MKWYWWPVVYLGTVPVMTVVTGYIDEWSADVKGTTREPAGGLYVIGGLWPLAIAFSLPELGRNLYIWRKRVRARQAEHKLRVEAEQRVIREERAKLGMYRRQRRFLDLRK